MPGVKIFRVVGLAALIAFCSSLSFAQLMTVTIAPISGVPGKASIYKVSFVVADTLTSEAGFEFQFPSAFDLSNLRLAGSNSITGGLNVITSGQTVRVMRTGRGDPILPNTNYEFMMANIVNPDAGRYLVQAKLLTAGGAASGEPVEAVVIIEQ